MVSSSTFSVAVFNVVVVPFTVSCPVTVTSPLKEALALNVLAPPKVWAPSVTIPAGVHRCVRDGSSRHVGNVTVDISSDVLEIDKVPSSKIEA